MPDNEIDYKSVGLSGIFVSGTRKESNKVSKWFKKCHLKMEWFRCKQAYINPHFLYNTLDSVSCAALIDGKKHLSEVLSSLAKLFRYNITRPEQLVTLREDFEMVNKYIEIQQFRYDGHIRLSSEISPEVMCTKVSKTILQPLVENGIQYGGMNAEGNYCISIWVGFAEEAQDNTGQKDNLVTIRICNEYHNIADSQEKIVEVLNDYLCDKCDLKRKSSGMGIMNVHQRIRLAFGEQYGIHYELGKECIAAVIRLPFFS